MFTWVLAAASATLFFGLVNVLDSLILKKYLREPLISLIFGSTIWSLSVISVSFLLGGRLVSPEFLIVALINGYLSLCSITLYLKALLLEETSRVIIVLQTTPLFVFFISVLLLHEALAPKAVIAFFCIFSGSLLASIEFSRSKFHISPGTLYALCAAMVSALVGFCWKYLSALPLWSGLLTAGLGTISAVWSLMIIPGIRKKVITAAHELPKRAYSIFLLGSSAAFCGRILMFLAMAVGPLAIVMSLGGFQPLFVLFWSFVLGKFIAEVREGHDLRSVLQKLAAAAIMVVGIFLLQ